MKKLWDSSFVDDRGAMLSVSANGGWVIAGGYERLCRLRPGDESPQVREHPEGDDSICSVAVEPGKGRRLAVLSMAHLVVFDPMHAEKYAHINFAVGTPEPFDVAWGRVKGKLVPHFADEEMRVLRAGDETEELTVEHVVKLSNGRNGTLAIVSGGDEPALYVTSDGDVMHYRRLDEIYDEHSVHVDVDGVAAAVSSDETLWISRGQDEAFEAVEDLEHAGPVAFDDTGGVLVALHEPEGVAIARVDAVGAVTRVAEMASGSDEAEPLRVAALAWDASRKTIWSATNRGLVVTRAPRELLS